LGVGVGGRAPTPKPPIPNPQSPIPNPQSPININKNNIIIKKFIIYFLNLINIIIKVLF